MSESGKHVDERRGSGGSSRKKISGLQQSNQAALALDLLQILLRRKWRLLIPIIICTVVAVPLAFIMPPLYRSTTLILIERQQVPEQYVTPADTTPVEQKLNTIKQQIMSRTKLEQIIKDFNLLKKEQYKGSTNLFSKGAPPSMEDMVEQMRKDIKVTVIAGKRRGEGAEAFSISFVGRDPQVTMEITNAISSLFIEENLRLREQYAEGTSEFLDSELKKAQKELEEQEKTFRVFKERYIGSLPEQLDANLRTLDRLQSELQSVRDSNISLESRRVSLESQLVALAPTRFLPPGEAPLGSEPESLEATLENLKNQLSNLLTIYSDKYPDVISARRRIEKIEKLLASASREGGSKETKLTKPKPVPETFTRRGMTGQSAIIKFDLEAVKSQINPIRKRKETLKKQIKVFEKRVEDTPANEQRLVSLQRNYEMSQGNYQSLLQKKLSARLAENLEKRQKGERFRVIDPANLPEKPFKPDKLKIILLGMLAGVGIGAGLIYMAEFLNPAFRNQEDLEGVLAQPVLAVIPLFPETDRNKSKSGFKFIKRQVAATK